MFVVWGGLVFGDEGWLLQRAARLDGRLITNEFLWASLRKSRGGAELSRTNGRGWLLYLLGAIDSRGLYS